MVIFEEIDTERFSVGAGEMAELVGFDSKEAAQAPRAGDDLVNEGELEGGLRPEVVCDRIGELGKEVLFEGFDDGLVGGETVGEVL